VENLIKINHGFDLLPNLLPVYNLHRK